MKGETGGGELTVVGVGRVGVGAAETWEGGGLIELTFLVGVTGFGVPPIIESIEKLLTLALGLGEAPPP